MNPWALVVIGIGILLVIIGVKGTQQNVKGAITGSSGQQKQQKQPAPQGGSGTVTFT